MKTKYCPDCGSKTTWDADSDSSICPKCSDPIQTMRIPRPELSAFMSIDLVVLGGADKGKAYELLKGETVIGRSDEADIRIPDLMISRRHARLTVDGYVVTINDLDSRNGVFVGDQRIKSIVLPIPAKFTLGTIEFDLVPRQVR